ncbi:MAG: TatD family deoxyribonuclease [Zetaproteobacteria bacterium]|nr:MAG: TatD family deoxyribonuclease [Zetaproteobacteria bacterium]
MRLVDTHCHLDFPEFNEDRAEVVARMREADVVLAVLVGVDLVHHARLVETARAFGFPHTVGLHPNARTQQEPAPEALAELAEASDCVAIGETGLDFYRQRVPPEAQIARLRAHVRAARLVGKPLVIHMREADEATLSVLEEEKAHEVGGVMHCFSSTPEIAKRALALGMMISFSGNLSYPRNAHIREAAKIVPEDRLLVETDAPYLAPQPVRGRRNEPAFVRYTAEALAAARGTSVETIAEQTTANAIRLFGLERFLR